MICTANVGALGNMTPPTARQLIEKIASNSQQFGARSDTIVVRLFIYSLRAPRIDGFISTFNDDDATILLLVSTIRFVVCE